jgi:RNA-binding protein
MKLTGSQRRLLAKKAHHLDAVVMVGKDGPTENVLGAVSSALDHHELIKVRFQSHKDEKRDISEFVADKLDAALVQVIGNIAVLYRPSPDPDRRTVVLPQK